jgi:hypothetical protein
MFLLRHAAMSLDEDDAVFARERAPATLDAPRLHHIHVREKTEERTSRLAPLFLQFEELFDECVEFSKSEVPCSSDEWPEILDNLLELREEELGDWFVLLDERSAFAMLVDVVVVTTALRAASVFAVVIHVMSDLLR